MNNRSNEVAKLTHIIEKINNKVINLNGNWGAGKTFLANKLSESLSTSHNYLTIKIELANYEYTQDPLIPFYIAIVEAINNIKDNDSRGIDKKLVFERIARIAMVTASLLNIINPRVGDGIKSLIDFAKNAEIEKTPENIIEENLKNYKSYNMILEDLVDIINDVGVDVIIFIDDFERIDPKFSYRILNSIHQIQNKKNIDTSPVIQNDNQECNTKNRLIFCLIMNRQQYETQLENIFGSIYGPCGQEHYLTKFIDLEYTVVAPNIDDIITKISKTDNWIYLKNILINLPSARYMYKIDNYYETFNKILNDVGTSFQYHSTAVYPCLFVFIISIVYEFQLNSCWYDINNDKLLKKTISTFYERLIPIKIKPFDYAQGDSLPQLNSCAKRK